jgi:hypothetical protein
MRRRLKITDMHDAVPVRAQFIERGQSRLRGPDGQKRARRENFQLQHRNQRMTKLGHRRHLGETCMQQPSACKTPPNHTQQARAQTSSATAWLCQFHPLYKTSLVGTVVEQHAERCGPLPDLNFREQREILHILYPCLGAIPHDEPATVVGDGYPCRTNQGTRTVSGLYVKWGQHEHFGLFGSLTG